MTMTYKKLSIGVPGTNNLCHYEPLFNSKPYSVFMPHRHMYINKGVGRAGVLMCLSKSNSYLD